jgi:hypothetical protein
VELHKAKIPAELLDEMAGLAASFTRAGVPTTVDDIIGWNAYMELTGYWWPSVKQNYAAATAGPGSLAKSHCSAFIATGSATTPGEIVLGHETFTEFWNGQHMNMILDIAPTEGYSMVFQACPGWIASMTDFWVTGAGLMVAETTIVGYAGYDVTKTPNTSGPGSPASTPKASTPGSTCWTSTTTAGTRTCGWSATPSLGRSRTMSRD